MEINSVPITAMPPGRVRYGEQALRGTPSIIGELYFATDTLKLFVATGIDNSSDWVETGGSGGGGSNVTVDISANRPAQPGTGNIGKLYYESDTNDLYIALTDLSWFRIIDYDTLLVYDEDNLVIGAGVNSIKINDPSSYVTGNQLILDAAALRTVKAKAATNPATYDVKTFVFPDNAITFSAGPTATIDFTASNTLQAAHPIYDTSVYENQYQFNQGYNEPPTDNERYYNGQLYDELPFSRLRLMPYFRAQVLQDQTNGDILEVYPSGILVEDMNYPQNPDDSSYGNRIYEDVTILRIGEGLSVDFHPDWTTQASPNIANNGDHPPGINNRSITLEASAKPISGKKYKTLYSTVINGGGSGPVTIDDWQPYGGNENTYIATRPTDTEFRLQQLGWYNIKWSARIGVQTYNSGPNTEIRLKVKRGVVDIYSRTVRFDSNYVPDEYLVDFMFEEFGPNSTSLTFTAELLTGTPTDSCYIAGDTSWLDASTLELTYYPNWG